MFELFNKRSYKCSGVVIPDTLIVNTSGIPVDWYFYNPYPSKGQQKNFCDDIERNGVIMKKNRDSISDENAYVAFFNNSLISDFGIGAFETEVVHQNPLFKELTSIMNHRVTHEIIKELKFLMPEQSLS